MILRRFRESNKGVNGAPWNYTICNMYELGPGRIYVTAHESLVVLIPLE